MLRESSRDPDSPARYGGEELSLIFLTPIWTVPIVIADRIRAAVEGLRIARTDGRGVLRITASLGVTASTAGRKDALIAEADAALYEAKRRGKDRTVSAATRTAGAPGGG